MAEPAKKDGKKEEKKEVKKSERGILMGLVLSLAVFVGIPILFAVGALLLAYLAFGGQITWHGI